MRKLLLVLFLIFLGSENIFSFWNGKFFIEIFPVARLSTRNFHTEPIDQLYYLSYFNQQRILNTGIDLEWKGLHLYLAIDIFRDLIFDSINFGYSNIPMTPAGLANSVNNNWPTVSYLEYRHDIIELSLGRRGFAMGYGDYGLALSPTAPYFDGFWLGLKPPVGKGKLFYYFAAFADDRLANENYLQHNEKIWNDNHPASSEKNPFSYQQISKWYFNHKIGYAGANWRFGISESSVIYGVPVILWNANPFTFWHNLYERGMNVSFGISGEAIFDKIRIYGEFLLDDVRLTVEGDMANPSAFGIYIGVDYHVLDNQGYQGHIYGSRAHVKHEESFAYQGGGLLLSWQFILATSYLYSRSIYDPYGKLTMMNNIRGEGGDKVIEYFIGSPYGPDSIVFEFSTRYEQPNWYFLGHMALQLQGRHGYDGFYSDATGWQAQGLYDPSRTSDWFFSSIRHVNLHISMQIYYLLASWCSLYAGWESRLMLNNIQQSRSTIETGVAMRF